KPLMFKLDNLLQLSDLKQTYIDLLDPTIEDESKRIMLLDGHRYKLKNGKQKNATSGIYINHRRELFTSFGDRKFFALLLAKLLSQNLPKYEVYYLIDVI